MGSARAGDASEHTEAAAGNGIAYLNRIREIEKEATVKDKVAAGTKFDAIKRAGVVGPLKLDNFDAFISVLVVLSGHMTPHKGLLQGAGCPWALPATIGGPD